LLKIKFRRQSRIYVANALRTTHSTFACLAKGGTAPNAFGDDAKTNRQSRKTPVAGLTTFLFA
jgi:hypothetical protein